MCLYVSEFVLNEMFADIMVNKINYKYKGKERKRRK